MKKIILLIVCMVLTTTAFSQEWPITYDYVSNPDLLVKLLLNRFANQTANTYTYTPGSEPSIPAEGMVYYDESANALYLYTGAAFILIGTENGTSLGGAYTLGSKIDADTLNVEIEVADGANNSALHIDHDEATNDNTAVLLENAADAANAISIDIDAQTTGRDVEGTGASWYFTGAGLAYFTGGSNNTGDFTFNDTYDILWDTSEDTLIAQDNAKFAIGTNIDFVWSYDNTDGNLEAAAANDAYRFGETTNFDFFIHGGTNTNVVTFDTDDAALEAIFDGFDLRMNDDDVIIFGDSSEFTIEYDEDGDDDLVIVAATANDAVQVGDGTTGTDFVLQSSGGANNEVRFDASGDTNIGQLLVGADDYGIDAIFFGATASQQVYWDQSADTWYFGNDAEGVDVYFNADTTSDYVMWDETDEALEWVGAQLHLDDASILQFGTDKDFTVYSDTANTLEFDPSAAGDTIKLGTANTDAVDVIWYSDSSGDTVTFNEEDIQVEFEDVPLVMMDDTAIEFGDATDASLQYDEDGFDGLQVTGVMYGARMLTESVTAADTITTAESGRVFYVTNDTDGIILTLPSVAAGDDGVYFTVYDANAVAASDVQILPSDSDTVGGGTGFTSDGNDEVCSIKVVYIHASTDWAIISNDSETAGTWNAD